MDPNSVPSVLIRRGKSGHRDVVTEDSQVKKEV